MAREIFRKESLERLASPDDLDRLLVVVDRKSWLPIATLMLTCAGGVLWAVFGTIPITVNGQGILVNPGNVRGIQSLADGQLQQLNLRVGQYVRKGDVIGEIVQADLKKQLEQEKSRLAELRHSHDAQCRLEDARLRLEQEVLTGRRASMKEEISKSTALMEAIRTRSEKYNEVQLAGIEKSRDASQRLDAALVARLKAVRDLTREGLTSGDMELGAETSVMENKLRLAEIDVDMHELELRKIESQRSLLEQRNRIADLSKLIAELEIQKQRSDQELLQSRTLRELAINEAVRSIDRITLNLDRQGKVRSDVDGRILEVVVAPGQVVSSGTRLATIELDVPNSELKNLAYFSVKDGKLLRPGMRILVTPATVQRERYGAIVGKLTAVSRYPITSQGAENLLGNAEIARTLIQEGAMIEVEAELESDGGSFSGYRWTSAGPPLKFSAGTPTTVRITVEERAPITYLLPALRAWALGEKDDLATSL